jgi:hypothetical protein
MDGKNRSQLGDLSLGREVDIVVDDDGAYGTLGTRLTRVDETGQEWVKLNGQYWKYPEQVEY